MNVINSEPLIPLTAAAKHIPSGKAGKKSAHVHVATLHRWRKQGVAGVRLRCVRIGQSWYTTETELRQFVEALSSGCGATTEPQPAAIPAGLQKAEARLEAMGI
jgi:hypothetical protein